MTVSNREKGLEGDKETIIYSKIKELESELKREREKRKTLESKVNNIREGSNTTSDNSKGGISRREFIKKASLGTVGIAALMSPVSALNVKSDSFSVFADSGNTSYLHVGETGPVSVQNTNLNLNDNSIENISELFTDTLRTQNINTEDLNASTTFKIPSVSEDPSEPENRQIWINQDQDKLKITMDDKIIEVAQIMLENFVAPSSAAIWGGGGYIDGQMVTDGQRYIYLVAGYDSSSNTDELWRFDAQNQLWSKLNSAPMALREGASGYDTENEAIYLTGYDGDEPTGNHFFRYDVGSDSWETLDDFEGSQSRWAMGIVYNSQFFVFGGENREVNIYDIENESWQSGADAPFELSAVEYARIGNRFYLSGSSDDGSSGSNAAYYDLEEDSWNQIEDKPFNNTRGAAANDSGDYLVFGGDNAAKYDTQNEVWEDISKSFTAYRGAALNLRNKVYLLDSSDENVHTIKEGSL